ncbi:mitochondrial chaperone bcs1 [Seiridium cupressi]
MLSQEVLNWIKYHVLPQQSSRTLTASTFEAGYGQRDDRAEAESTQVEYLSTFGTIWFFFERNLFMVRQNLDRRMFSMINKADQCIRAPRVIRASKSGSWGITIFRPLRSLSTIHLEERLKDDVISDINHYLKPETRQFYLDRGIPYRRGYLLYGPPGTGKSSFAFALAGHFQLALCVLNLPAVHGDTDLEKLFVKIPTRCIVLLEDIDAVVLDREKKKSMLYNQETDAEKAGTTKKKHGACTLSGLLNVLDGVTAQQGRIVLMTTNHAENLDAALIRPGRVDRTFFLGKIKKETAKKMFLAMFAPGSTADRPAPAETIMQASEFAELVPEDTLTPAHLQSFFLVNLKAPGVAIARFPEWLEEENAHRGVGEDRDKKESVTKDDVDKPQDYLGAVKEDLRHDLEKRIEMMTNPLIKELQESRTQSKKGVVDTGEDVGNTVSETSSFINVSSAS